MTKSKTQRIIAILLAVAAVALIVLGIIHMPQKDHPLQSHFGQRKNTPDTACPHAIGQHTPTLHKKPVDQASEDRACPVLCPLIRGS